VQINKRNLFKLILYGPFFVICILFSLCLARYFILNRYCKASLYNGVVLLHMSVIWYFPPCYFFVFLCHKNICIVKQMHINFSVLSTPVKLIISLWDCVCMCAHSSVNVFFVCLSGFFVTFSFHWQFMMVLKAGRMDHRFSKCSVRSPRAPREKPRGSASCSFTYVFIFRNLLWGSANYGQSLHGLHNTKSLRNPGLDDVMVFHQSFVTNETVTLSCLWRDLLWMMLLFPH